MTEDEDLENISASLRRFREEALKRGYDKGYAAGFEAGGVAMRERILAATMVQVTVDHPIGAESQAPKERPAPTPKAPRGSVEKVVNVAFSSHVLGASIADIMGLVASGTVPTVSEGSVRNHLRFMEKAGKAHKRGDIWHIGPDPNSKPSGDSASTDAPLMPAMNPARFVNPMDEFTQHLVAKPRININPRFPSGRGGQDE